MRRGKTKGGSLKYAMKMFSFAFEKEMRSNGREKPLDVGDEWPNKQTSQQTSVKETYCIGAKRG